MGFGKGRMGYRVGLGAVSRGLVRIFWFVRVFVGFGSVVDI